MDVVWELVALVLLVAVTGTGPYLIASRSGMFDAWVAWIPIIGPQIVLLRAAGLSGFWILAIWIPFVGIGVFIWSSVKLAQTHGRTAWWVVAFVFLPVIGHLWYGLTLPRASPPPVDAGYTTLPS